MIIRSTKRTVVIHDGKIQAVAEVIGHVAFGGFDLAVELRGDEAVQSNPVGWTGSGFHIVDRFSVVAGRFGFGQHVFEGGVGGRREDFHGGLGFEGRKVEESGGLDCMGELHGGIVAVDYKIAVFGSVLLLG
nr:hypothetical protein Itr_chr06CG07540 [Ipomoea trifida]